MRINGSDIPIEPGVLLGQMAYVLFGLLLILLGAAILYTIAKWAFRGRKVEGEVLGVRRRGTQFHSVYRYALQQGGWGEATSVQGSSSLAGRGTGTRRLIRILPGDTSNRLPDHAEEAREPSEPRHVVACTWPDGRWRMAHLVERDRMEAVHLHLDILRAHRRDCRAVAVAETHAPAQSSADHGGPTSAMERIIDRERRDTRTVSRATCTSADVEQAAGPRRHAVLRGGAGGACYCSHPGPQVARAAIRNPCTRHCAVAGDEHE